MGFSDTSQFLIVSRASCVAMQELQPDLVVHSRWCLNFISHFGFVRCRIGTSFVSDQIWLLRAADLLKKILGNEFGAAQLVFNTINTINTINPVDAT